MMGRKGPQSNGRSKSLLNLEELTQRSAACRASEGWSLPGPTHLEPPGTHWPGEQASPACEARCFSTLTTNHQAVGSLCLLYLLPFLGGHE